MTIRRFMGMTVVFMGMMTILINRRTCQFVGIVGMRSVMQISFVGIVGMCSVMRISFVGIVGILGMHMYIPKTMRGAAWTF